MTIPTQQSLISNPSVDRALDEMFAWVDHACCEDHFDLVDAFLAGLDPATLGEDLCVGALSITSAARPYLLQREGFLLRCVTAFPDWPGLWRAFA